MGIVPPYCGQNQSARINVPAKIAHQQVWEESCWVLPNYCALFPEVPNAQIEETRVAVVPPPIAKTDLWSAQQTWPL